MKKMLKLTDEILKLPFNDNIRYEEGDDVSKQIESKVNNDSLSIALQALYKEAPALKTKANKAKGFDELIPYKTEVIFEDNYELTREYLDRNMDRLYILYDNNSEEEAIRLSKDFYDGVIFFADTNKIKIPSCILEYVNKHKSMKICRSIYKYNPDVKEFSVAKLPEKKVYSYFGEEKYGNITTGEGQWFYLCKDIPYKYYSKNLNIDARTLAYNKDDKTFIGHSGDNYAKMSHLCYELARSGLPIPVAAYLNQNGTLTLYGSNKKQMLAQYLKCPTIPMIIISGPINSNPFLNYTPKGDVKALNELVNPYFMVM